MSCAASRAVKKGSLSRALSYRRASAGVPCRPMFSSSVWPTYRTWNRLIIRDPLSGLLSLSGPPAVHDERGAGDVRRALAREEARDGRHLLHGTAASERHQRADELEVRADAAHHRRRVGREDGLGVRAE